MRSSSQNNYPIGLRIPDSRRAAIGQRAAHQKLDVTGNRQPAHHGGALQGRIARPSAFERDNECAAARKITSRSGFGFQTRAGRPADLGAENDVLPWHLSAVPQRCSDRP
jgi:hypothetical protein